VGIFFGSGTTEKRQFAPERIISPFPGTDASGRVTVGSNPDTALQVSAVWACTRLLADSVSIMPLETFRRSKGIPARVNDPLIITEPSPGVLQSEWVHQVMVSLCLRGNAFGHMKMRDENTDLPTQVELLDPDSLNIRVNEDTGLIEYRDKNDKQIPTEDIWHVRGMTMPGDKVGLSPVTYAARTIGIDLAAQKFGLDFLDGAGNPKAVMESDQAITQEQASTIKDRFMAATRNRQPAVLGAGLKYMAIQIKPEESQFLATQHANVGDIARYFSVPAEMVGGPAGGGMTYTNREQRALDFLTFTVAFWMRRIEDAVSVLLPSNVYTKFNAAVLLRTDAETQAKIHVQQLAGKTRTPTEIRAVDNLPPLTPAQKIEIDMVPLSITPLGSAKGLPDLKLPPGPAAPLPADDKQGEPANG
jgi:HK97 family phage portal protein